MSNRYLTTLLRHTLEKAAMDARIVAEEGAREAIRRLGVGVGKAPGYLSDSEKELRRRLRAHARALGDAFDRKEDTQETKRLIEAAAYAHWHRLLFARFLAERGLLRNPEHDVAVTLEDCRELAEAEGLADAWAVAERYAAAMLPAVFPVADPVLALDLDAMHIQKLQRLVKDLDAEVFQSEDSLGWTYQFWRASEKDAINDSGVKIGADELPAVTQLFTEPYMVRFLLHNTLGAWWAAKVLAANIGLAKTTSDEEALRAACSLPGYTFDMLRFVREGENGPWRPAAGTFSDWPKDAKAITMLDPCCGSGHFLTEALAILTALRQAEERLSAASAVAAVLQDNLHGLEIDGRCVQIAVFAVALTAWRIGGSQTLPLPHIAWVGAPPPLPKREFTALGEGDPELEYALGALHDLFAQAPILGSLLEPSSGDLFEAEKMREITRLLEPLLANARRAEPERIEGMIAARGMADAARMLHRKYVLQATNVPYLGRKNQGESLAVYLKKKYPTASADLAFCVLDRMLSLAQRTGTVCGVFPDRLLYLGRYRDFRASILARHNWNFSFRIGTGGFDSISGEVVSVTLLALEGLPQNANAIAVADVGDQKGVPEKERMLINGRIDHVAQGIIQLDPDLRISKHASEPHARLQNVSRANAGMRTGDAPQYILGFWETDQLDGWLYQQTTVDKITLFGGCSNIVHWENGQGRYFEYVQAQAADGYRSGVWKAGSQVWGKTGVLVSQMGSLPVSRYLGYAFDNNTSAIVSPESELEAAIWCYCSSKRFNEDVRKLDKALKVTNATLVKVPFDRATWEHASKEAYPAGLPEPYSNDPTQWLFHGHPANSAEGTALHVALARLCGYRWPAEKDTDLRLSDEARDWVTKVAALPAGDNDGLLGVRAVAGEEALADRLRIYLAASFGSDWGNALERRLVAEADSVLDKKTARDGSLEAWLRDRAFRQHCALFGQRPFLWHISDGVKDGFSVFIHYHRFDQANLRKLTYTMLGDWLARSKAENNSLRYEKGRELQQMLEKVLEGEKPYDTFVRWKSLAQQPIGWVPDLNDGVRQNIRPFIEACVLVHDLSRILKAKDRGDDVTSAPWYSTFKGERRNDHHTTLAEKRAAREAASKRAKAPK
jgi:hypothetical protein